MKSETPYSVLGYGAPVVDFILKVSQEFYDSLPGEKGGMEPVTYSDLQQIVRESGVEPVMIPGGSTGNMLRGLAALGDQCALLGKVGRDAAGRAYAEALGQAGIQGCYNGNLLQTETPTSIALCVVASGGERTMRTFMGASTEVRPEEITSDQLQGVELLHVEGYGLYGLQPMLRVLELARNAGVTISLDLASFEVVRRFRGYMERVLREFVDVVFANEDEVRELTGRGSEDGCESLAEICDTAVVMMGRKGCVAMEGGETVHQPALLVEDPVDTTGAGDLFASGFLHALLKGGSLEACCHLGALCGSHVVQEMGAVISEERWAVIREEAGADKLALT